MPLTLAEDNRLHVDGALQVTTMTLFWKENWILNNQSKYIFFSYINCLQTSCEKKYWVETSSLWNKTTL